MIDGRNDSQVIFYDQVIPGSSLVGYINADHWAIAVPIARTHETIGVAVRHRERLSARGACSKRCCASSKRISPRAASRALGTACDAARPPAMRGPSRHRMEPGHVKSHDALIAVALAGWPGRRTPGSTPSTATSRCSPSRSSTRSARRMFDRLWGDARAGHEQRLCEQAADAEQGLAPACIDWAALPAIAGDHSCSSKNMLDNALEYRLDSAGRRRGGAAEGGPRARSRSPPGREVNVREPGPRRATSSA